MKPSLILLFFLLGLSSKTLSQVPTWQPLGNDDANKATFEEVNHTAVITVGADIYIAFSDKQVANKITVRKNSGGVWSDVVMPGFSNGPAYNVSMIADPSGMIYVAYLDSSLTNNLVVKKLAGSAWTDVGAASLPTGTLQLPSLTVSPAGVPYLSFIDPADIYKVSVIKFDNGNWSLIGSKGVSLPYAFYTDVAVDANGIVYMNYGESAVNMQNSYVMKFDGSTWTTLNILNSPVVYYATHNPDIIVDASNHLLVLHRNPTSGRATLTKYNGSTWTTIGSAEFSDGGSSDLKLAIAANNTLYAAYSDNSLNGSVVVKYFSGNSWTVTDNTRASQVSSFSLAVDNSNAPVLFHNNYYWNIGLVKKHVAGNWEIVGPQGLAGGMAFSLGGVMDTAGIPVVGFSSFKTGKKPTILKYTNNSWNNYTSINFTDTTVDVFGLAFSNKNELYVAYFDKRLSNKITVKRLNGNTWDTIGMPGFAVLGDYTSFHVGTNNTPYVTSQNPIDFWRATVWKFDGTAWVKVGGAGLSSDKVFDISMTTDNTGNVYVAYRNLYGGSFLVVKKFDGTAWSDLGFTAVASGVLPSVAVDNNNNVYVAYVDASAGNRITVRKYSGSTWSLVGAAGSVNTSMPEGILLSIKNGVPFVSYRDVTEGLVAKAKMFDGTGWVDAAQGAISAKGTISMMLAHSKQRTIAVYTDVDAFVKELVVPQTINNTTPDRNTLVEVWPNPVTSELNVLCPTENAKTVSIFGIDGKLHFRRELDGRTKSFTIATHTWARGVYVVSVVSKGDAASSVITLE